MKVVIVAKTRRGAGACVGGITWEGTSVRLVAHDAVTNARAGLEYNVGEAWELQTTPDPRIIAPHGENVIVRAGRRLQTIQNLEAFIWKRMPPMIGNPFLLFEGLLQISPSGGLFIAERTGVPARSTMFWVPDKPLRIDLDGKRIHYRYPTPERGVTLVFVGFQEPVETIPPGTLLRVSLAHWWRPQDKPEEELRCYAQLSHWYGLDPEETVRRERCQPSFASNTKSAPSAPVVASSLDTELSEARRRLKQVFGFPGFLPLQREVIRHVLQGRDALVIMPTGGGKSLCYQLPALHFDGLTLVVSPLIALMQDQVAHLHEIGVEAAFLNSTLNHAEYLAITDRIRSGQLRILYAAPETVLRPETLLLLKQNQPALLAVDEAHCISEWGHDFRPEYRNLEELRRRFPAAVCLALTATATQRVRADIRRILNIPAEGEFVGHFNRPNLLLEVIPRGDGLGQTLRFLEQHPGQSGIIYCSTRQRVDRLTTELTARGWSVLPYHAGLDDEIRRRNQDRFTHSDSMVMVATIAFGMGINKSNVRFILHFNLPKDLESYYQEIGRAGRDGLPADCLLLHSRADAVTIRHFIEAGAPSERPGRQARLEAMIQYAETCGCRRIPLLAYFGQTQDRPCGRCDRCLAEGNPVELTDCTAAARKLFRCIQQTGGVFGLAHIVNVLRGSCSKKVLEHRHDRLSSHGSGRDWDQRTWNNLARQLISQGLLKREFTFGGLSLTAQAREMWRKNQKVTAVLEEQKPTRSRTADPSSTHDPQFFRQLRELRRHLAAQAGVPPYVIFSDRTLVEIAAILPDTREELLALHGVGHAKLAHYGEAFLNCIREYRKMRTAGGWMKKN